MTEVRLLYEAGTNTIDDIFTNGKPHKKAQDYLRELYGDALKITVGLGLKKREYSDDELVIRWIVLMDADENTLEGAIKNYISEAGVPKEVDSFLNDGLIERALGHYGKRLKKRLFGLMPSEVVDP